MLAAACVLVVSDACAGGKPDTLALLKQYRQGLVGLTKRENLSGGTTTYRIEFFGPDDIDMFEADAANLEMLADYAYLYALYVGVYQNFSVEYLGVHPYYPLVSTGLKDGTGQALLDHYREQFKCAKDKDEQKCVLHGLKKAGGIRHYLDRFDEGRDDYLPVDP